MYSCAVTDVRPRQHAGTADEPQEKVAQDVPVQVLHQEHVEARRVEDQLRRAAVDVQLLAADVGVVARDVLTRLEEEPVGELHHVRLVNDRDLPTAPPAGVLEGVLLSLIPI